MGGLALPLPTSSSCSPLTGRSYLLSAQTVNPRKKAVRRSWGTCKLSIKASSEADSEAQTTSTSSSSSSSTTTATQLPTTEEAKSAGSDGGNRASPAAFNKEISQAVKKTAATFAPRSSTKSKNPAVPGSTLYTVFEVQGYVSMALGGLLSYNLVFPSSEPDLWRLMGMWSVWMFTIPSLRARDCSSKEKDALNYLFLGIPLINVVLPLFWKSFAAVWTADVVAFLAIYAWKLEWLSANQTMEK